MSLRPLPIVLASAWLLTAPASVAPQAPTALGSATTYEPAPCGVSPFTDVLASDPFCKWMKQLYADGITTTCNGGNYCPDNPVTRRQLAQALGRAMRGTSAWTPMAETAACEGIPGSVGQIWQYFDNNAHAELVCEVPETEVNDIFGSADQFAGLGGGSVNGAIAPAGDVDIFTLYANGPDISAETLQDIEGGSIVCGSIDTALSLYDASLVLLTSNDDGGAALCSKIILNTLTPGSTYYLVVQDSGDNDEIGFYRLMVSTF